MKMIYNWKPVVTSLIEHLQNNGVRLLTIDDGGEREDWIHIHQTMTPEDQKTLAVESICAVDSSELLVRLPDDKKTWLMIVLGNEPSETLADYSCHPLLDRIADEFATEWEDKECPTIESQPS